MSTQDSERGTGRTAEDLPLPGGDFRLFTARLSVQGMLALGLMENPLTGKATVNLAHARMMLDDLLMLAEKTSGNLDLDEADQLRKIISDLRFHLERAEAAASPQPGE